MKKIINFMIIIMICLTVSCKDKYPVIIPVGKWQYKLLLNGVEIGSAEVSNVLKDNKYISQSDMEMNAGMVKNTSRQIITETIKFKPVKLEIYNKIINKGNVQEINTIANFKGNNVELNAGEFKTNFKIDKSFFLPGNYFMSELIKKKFKQNIEIKAYVYEPSIESETALRTKMKVVGEKKIKINGKEETLIHIIQVIDKFKSVDIYMDRKGVTKKLVLIMLNTKLEMVIKE